MPIWESSSCRQSSPVAQKTEDNWGTSPSDRFQKRGARWQQRPPGPALVLRFDAARSHSIQVSSQRFCLEAVRAAADLKLASSQWHRTDLESRNQDSAPLLTPLKETKRWPDQIVHLSDHIPVAAVHCRFDNSWEIRPEFAPYLASISKSAPLEQGVECWRRGDALRA